MSPFPLRLTEPCWASCTEMIDNVPPSLSESLANKTSELTVKDWSSSIVKD